MQKAKVQVLMSSYNGEKYIEEQIESILNQKNVEVSLLVRDDGSNDSTCEILRNLERKSLNVKCVFEENIGVKKSFLKLISLSGNEYDYYAFSDQDDIWDDEKLITAVVALKKEDEGIPLIYGSSVYLYSDEEVIGKQFINPELKLGNFLIKNYYPGCTMVFNPKLRELINSVDFNFLNPYPLHDHWLNLVCTACGGKVIMDKTPHLKYRQHGDNAVGDRNIRQKIKGNGLIGHSENTRLRIAEELDKYYRYKEDRDSEKAIKKVIQYQTSLMNTLRLAFDKDIKPIALVEKISIFLIVMLRKF